MIAQKAVRLDPCWGVDTPTHITPELATAFATDGETEFFIRYVARSLQIHDKPHAYYDGWLYGLSRSEVDVILGEGFKLAAVQSYYKGTALTYNNGFLIGTIAAANLLGAGVRERIHLFLDLEINKAPSSDVLDYCDGWSKAVYPYFACGLYSGYEYLTGRQLYGLARFDCYWASAMKYVLDKPPLPRNWAMYQGRETRRHGIDIDPNELTGDTRGKGPIFLAAAAG